MCASFDHEVEVPGELVRPPVGAEAAVLTVVGFQAGRGVAPTERVSAGAAEPPLTTARIAAVPLGHAPALRTAFFGAMTPRSLNRFIDCSHMLRLSQTENEQAISHLIE